MCVTTRRSAVVWPQPRFTTTRANRDGIHPLNHLASHTGIIQADAYAG